MSDVTHRVVSGTMRTDREKRMVVRAAAHVDETISTFVRRACLARAVDVARDLPEPDEREEARV